MLTSVSMLLLNWRLALIVLSAIPVIAALAMYFQKRILKSYREMRKLNSRITSAFNEGIMGARTTKTLRREAENEREFESLTHSMKRSAVRAAVLSALFLPLVISLAALVMCYVLDLGGADVLKNGLTIGTLAAFISYATQIFEPINSIARLFADLQSSQAAAERVMSMLETEPEISDAPEVVELFGDSFHPKRENWPDIRGDIAFEGVGFRYSEGGEVLSNFDLTVRAGETIALVGETGAGKSTIVNLLCRFYEPTEGRILIDGSDYRTRSMLWLQSHLGYVLQQPHLFSGTVRENIRYGKLDATDEEVETAARLVDAEEFILKLEKGYDTDVGEGGDRLSIGQKQLVSFARALIADPKIFVLDEATSSVDTETEQRIQRAIRESLRGRTSFIIAHRLSTIRTADRILVVRGGRITEQGTHRELLKLKGYYYDLYVNQFQDEMEKSVLGKA
ncbi:MAG: putative ABC transporter ATP-binding protein [Firmicutes bacterium ADurb.Bin467]|nr:MAG: putative ABC transporter ATP-binding protein [Firmicutes bacterium ADurb.Bin467]